MHLLAHARRPRVLGAALVCAALTMSALPAYGTAMAAVPQAHQGPGDPAAALSARAQWGPVPSGAGPHCHSCASCSVASRA